MKYYYENTDKWDVYYVTEETVNSTDEFELGGVLATLRVPLDIDNEDFDKYIIDHVIDNSYMLTDEALGRVYVEAEDGTAIVRCIETGEIQLVLIQQRIIKRIQY